jgi:hypothetical protein
MPTARQEEALEKICLEWLPRVPTALYFALSHEQHMLYNALEDAYYGIVPEDKLNITMTQWDYVEYFRLVMDWEQIQKGLEWLKRKGIIELRYGNIIGDEGYLSTEIVVVRVQTWAMNYMEKDANGAERFKITREPSGEKPEYEIEYTD